MTDKDRAEAAERRLNMLVGELAEAQAQIGELVRRSIECVNILPETGQRLNIAAQRLAEYVQELGYPGCGGEWDETDSVGDQLIQARSQVAQLEKNKQDLNKTIYWLLTIQKAYWTRQGQRGDDV